MTDAHIVSVYDIPFSDTEKVAIEWAKEALELRHGTAGDPDGKIRDVDLITSDFTQVLEMLERVRQRSDRVDELLAKATQARGRARRAEAQAKFSAEQAYDTAQRDNAQSRRTDFVSAAERHADAALDSLEERRVAHHAARLVSITQEAYDLIWQCHQQLEGLRTDLRSILRTLQWESTLEH